jgi:hypothetical protein
MEKTRVHLLSCVRKGVIYKEAQGIKHAVNYCSAFPDGRTTNHTTRLENELKTRTTQILTMDTDAGRVLHLEGSP